MMPAPAAVAWPGFAASTRTTSAPSELAAYAHEAPTMPEPTTTSRNSPHPAPCPPDPPTAAARQHSNGPVARPAGPAEVRLAAAGQIVPGLHLPTGEMGRSADAAAGWSLKRSNEWLLAHASAAVLR